MLDYLDTAVTVTDPQQLTALVSQGITYIETLQPKKHVPVDPEQLAFNLSKPIDREPFETPQQFQQFFSLPVESAQETGPRTRAGSRVRKKSAPPSPADLVETPEVQLTNEIRALAESLGHQPIKIFNWVHDNIEYLPAHGSIQGAQLTLDMKRGNAFDTASLLIALLRASNIEARYVYGTVQISIERVMKWLKVDTPNAAVELLAGAAIPHGISVVGGAIKAVKLEHLWVDAWIDFRPSRGARHRKGDSWVPMDASFKQHTLTNGINLLDEVPFDIEGLRDYLIETTDTNESGGVMGIEQWYLKDLLTNYQTQLQDYVETHNVQPEDVLDRYAIIPSRRPYFAAGLPYRRIAKLETFTEIPARYRHSLTIKFYHSAQSQALDNPAVSYTLNLPMLGNKRLSVTYEPASEADAQALNNFWASGAESLPVYLFRVKPVIKLDDTVLATGTSIGMGEPQYYTYTIQHPHTSYTHNAQATAGDVIAFGINGNGITKELVQKRLETVPSDTAEENMHQVGLHFWMERDWFDDLAAQVYQVRRQRMPSVGAFSLPLSVRYFFGIPRSGLYQSRQVDVKHNIQVVIAATNEARFNFMTQSGMHGSYIEGSVLDQLFGQQRQPGISASQLLMEAGHQNIPIYTITAENVNTILPILNVSQEVKSDIIHAVNSGRQAIVPEQELVHGNWTGSGYILQDLITGSGAYLLEGGYDGGGHGICFTSRKPPAMAITALSSAAAQQKMAEAFNIFFTTWASILDKIISSDFEYPSDEAKKGVMAAARNLATMVNQLVDETLGTSHGCLMIFANDINKEEIYVPFERDEQTGAYEDNVTVNFTSKVPDHCHTPRWDFGDGSTSTEPNATHIYSQPGKYHITLTATCGRTRSGNDETISADLVAFQVKMTLHQPKVIDPNETEIPYAKRRLPGAQTFVNLDNDDKDNQYDICYKDTDCLNSDTEIANEDEMLKLVIELRPGDMKGLAQLQTLSGSEFIRIWKASNKASEFDKLNAKPLLGVAELGFETTNWWGDVLKLELWIEGIKAHQDSQSTQLGFNYYDPNRRMGFVDQVNLTVIGIKSLNWLGRQNGYTPNNYTHDSNTLDADPNVSGTPSHRVFAGARAPDFNLPRDTVDLEVELTTEPIEEVDIFVRAFDLDDPYTDTPRTDITFPYSDDNGGYFIDPNDQFPQYGRYSGTQGKLIYTAEEDNRGAVAGDKAGRFECTDIDSNGYPNCQREADRIVKLTFQPGEKKKKVGFKVSHHPGDNYQAVAYGDKDFLKQLRNRDRDDGQYIVDKYIMGDLNQRQLRQSESLGIYTSPPLSVWRLLHVENDSMEAVPTTGPQRNQVEGFISLIYGYSDVASEVAIDVNLETELDSGKDPSAEPGRFENGTLLIGTDKVKIEKLAGNYIKDYDDLAQYDKQIVWRDEVDGGINIPFIVRDDDNYKAPVTGNVRRFYVDEKFGPIFELNVTSYTQLDQTYVDGMIEVAGVQMLIRRVNPEDVAVQVEEPVNIPYILTDDDDLNLLPTYSDLSMLTTAMMLASVLVVPDGGGNKNNDNDTVPFILNNPDRRDYQKTAAIYRNSRHSALNETNEFWVVYICSVYQNEVDADVDSDEEYAESVAIATSEKGIFVHDMNIARGQDSALISLEIRREEAEMNQESPNEVTVRNALIVAHEVGHQFGFTHGDYGDYFYLGSKLPEYPKIGLMSDENETPNFIPRHINLIRSRTASPGEEP